MLEIDGFEDVAKAFGAAPPRKCSGTSLRCWKICVLRKMWSAATRKIQFAVLAFNADVAPSDGTGRERSSGREPNPVARGEMAFAGHRQASASRCRILGSMKLSRARPKSPRARERAAGGNWRPRGWAVG